MGKLLFFYAVTTALTFVHARIHLYKEENFSRGEAVTIGFKPKNVSAQLGIALCKDATLVECYSLNLFGCKDGQVAYYFYRHGPNEKTELTTAPVSTTTPEPSTTPSVGDLSGESMEPAGTVEELEEHIGELYKEMLTPMVQTELAWVPGRKQQQPFTIIRNDWNMDNFDEWSPIKRYIFRVFRTDEGELRLDMAGLGLEQRDKIVFAVSDEYKYLTFGARKDQAFVRATRPRQISSKKTGVHLSPD